MAPKQTDPQFKLRMTPEIKEAIEKAAAQNNRSMNAEILARLEATFEPSAGPDEIWKALLELRSEVRELRKLREAKLRQTEDR